MQIGRSYFSFYKIAAFVLLAIAVCMLFMPWIAAGETKFGDVLYQYRWNSEKVHPTVFNTGITYYEDFAGSSDIATGSHFLGSAMSVFAVLYMAAFLAAVYGLYKDRNSYALFSVVFAIILFFLEIFQLFYLRNHLLSSYQEYRNDAFHIGACVWCFLLCTLGAFAFLAYEDTKRGRNPFSISQYRFNPKPNPVPAGNWECPNCHSSMENRKSFCSKCGTKKPEPKRCPACGVVLEPDEVFCSNCGARL